MLTRIPRCFLQTSSFRSQRALILGAYEKKMAGGGTSTLGNLVGGGQSFAQLNPHLTKQLQSSRFTGKKGDVRVLYNVSDEYPVVAVAGLGMERDVRSIEKCAELSRVAAANGIRALRPSLVERVDVDALLDPQATAEGVYLGSYQFTRYKKKTPANTWNPEIALYPDENTQYTKEEEKWKNGKLVASAQNLARELMEEPANVLTPQAFGKRAEKLFEGLPNVRMLVRDREWIERQNMNAFLAVTKGSEEPPVFLEFHYQGNPKQTDIQLGLVGKGVTFDSGGISIKPSAGMAMMKADMGGAAVVLSTLYGIVQQKLSINTSIFIPLCENMPSGTATRPGDIVRARNGKTIEVDNTDAEGRLILADALHYASDHHRPRILIDVATLTGAMDVALGSAMAGFFTPVDSLSKQLLHCGQLSNDLLWRMPLSPVYRKQIDSDVADLRNVGGRGAGSCTAAMFLQEFVATTANDETTDETTPSIQWAHIDMAGVMHHSGTSGYDIKGMSGRPTRALIALANHLTIME